MENTNFGWLYEINITLENKVLSTYISKYLFYAINNSLFLCYSKKTKIEIDNDNVNYTDLNESKLEKELNPLNKKTISSIFHKFYKKVFSCNQEYFNSDLNFKDNYGIIINDKKRYIYFIDVIFESKYFKFGEFTDNKCFTFVSTLYDNSFFVVQGFNDLHTANLFKLFEKMTFNCSNEQQQNNFTKSSLVTKNDVIILNKSNVNYHQSEKLICKNYECPKINNILSSVCRSKIKSDYVENFLEILSTSKLAQTKILTIQEWGELNNKSSYSGCLKENKPSGYGKEFCKDGLIYEGLFRDGKWNGIGIVVNDKLDSNTLEFIDGKTSGI